MYRARHHDTAGKRRGVILLVVITLLTLFAVAGLLFVLYAESEANSARIYREAVRPSGDDPAPIFSWALGELIYDVPDNDAPGYPNGVYSAIRGHSLARSMYGWVTPDQWGTGSNNPNTTPFNGTGRWHTGSANWPYMNALSTDDYMLPNYTFFSADGFLRDPEKLPPNLVSNPTAPWRKQPTDQTGPHAGGFNAPYTYPDLNNMYLAAVKADGTVLCPSFHRPWLFNPNYALNDPSNPNWTNAVGKYLLLRPRPADMGPGFPYPSDPGGDVKNLVGAPGGNDSIWIDLDYPVMTMPDGTKVKPLFAFLVRDLDGLVNVNVHGNIRYATAQTSVGQHASNQGWGKWEVDLSQVLTQGGGSEWPQVFTNSQYGRYGNGQQPAGGGQQSPLVMNPLNQNQVPTQQLPPWYGSFDYDASQQGMAGNSPTTALKTLMPTAGNSPFTAFPAFSATSSYSGYNSGTQNATPAWDERTNHPLLYNYYSPEATGDRRFSIAAMKALWYAYSNQANTEYTTCDLGQALPNNMGNARTRNLISTLSADLDRPGVVPWVWNPSPTLPTPPNSDYAWNSGQNYPQPGALAFPSALLRSSGNPPANSEFSSFWHSLTAAVGRVDLSRPLTEYPTADATTGLIAVTSYPQFTQAQQDRVQLAQDIYTALCQAVGVGNPTAAGFTPPAPPTAEYYGLQWLAQLAVNIVDYIDDDDYSTPFGWYPNFTTPTAYVYGTEVPRIVVNEVYAQVNNNPMDVTAKKATNPYNFNLWVELHNPMNTDNALPDTGAARLLQGVTNAPIYQLQVLDTANPANNPGIRDRSNVDGSKPSASNQFTLVDTFPLLPDRVLPANGAYAATGVGTNAPTTPPSNIGFYVLGPDNTGSAAYNTTATPSDDPGIPTTATTTKLTAQIPLVNTYPNTCPPTTAVLLRRLACPGLPPNPTAPGTPTSPYNPYITIDYVDGVQVWDARQYISVAGVSMANPNFAAWAGRSSFGRREPYASDATTQWVAQSPINPPNATANLKKHTFFQHNAKENADPTTLQPSQAITPAGNTLTTPFNWMVHPDRPLISPMELLHVSGYKPHELTQQFVTAKGAFQHMAPWTDQTARIFRFLELAECHDRAAGGTVGGRTAGLVNVNTIWDPDTLVALCDPQSSNSFQASAVYNSSNPSDKNTVWGKLVAQRTPNLLAATPSLGKRDRPFIGLGTGYSTLGANPTTPLYYYYDPNDPSYDPNDPMHSSPSQDFTTTVLGSNVFRVGNSMSPYPGNHPYFQSELLTKIFNNVTTRSNVFAVWCTIGYFKVTDDTVRPVKLGPEVSGQGPYNRHQFFAIVDRTNLTINPSSQQQQGAAPFYVTSSAALSAPGGVITVPANYEGNPVNIAAGSTLVADVGQNEEPITVATSTTTGSSISLTVTCTKSHAAGFQLTNVSDLNRGFTSQVILGNPGPQPNFDYRSPTYAPVVRYFAVLR